MIKKCFPPPSLPHVSNEASASLTVATLYQVVKHLQKKKQNLDKNGSYKYKQA